MVILHMWIKLHMVMERGAQWQDWKTWKIGNAHQEAFGLFICCDQLKSP
jgi:hypothetical protein